MDIRFADIADLDNAYQNSWYFIAGTGEPLEEWVTGYEGLMAEQEIGKPTMWFKTNGGTINAYADSGKYVINPRDRFAGDLVCLLFPLDGLDIGRLPIFKIQMQDRWFDDVIQNMRWKEEDDD